MRASVGTGPGDRGAWVDPACAVFDLGAVPPELLNCLVVRGARPGDRFRPYGLGGSVRLFRWLRDRGVARAERPNVPVVAAGELILWVIGHRRADVAPVRPETTQRLILEQV